MARARGGSIGKASFVFGKDVEVSPFKDNEAARWKADRAKKLKGTKPVVKRPPARPPERHPNKEGIYM